jgi:hypothetical protein
MLIDKYRFNIVVFITLSIMRKLNNTLFWNNLVGWHVRKEAKHDWYFFLKNSAWLAMSSIVDLLIVYFYVYCFMVDILKTIWEFFHYSFLCWLF